MLNPILLDLFGYSESKKIEDQISEAVFLLFAMLLGVFVFAEKPDAVTLLGSLLIVLSGGYTLIQSRRTVALKMSENMS